MAVLLLCSASGSPGVTVTALGLALTWPRDVLLADVDRTPAQTILAGYLRGGAAGQRGLSAVLQAHRERRPVVDAVNSEALPLPTPPGRRPAFERERPTQRRFLPGFAHPGAVEVFGAVWRDLAEVLQAGPCDAVLDAGRIGTRGLPLELTDAVDRVGLVCRASLVSLAGVRLYLAPLLEQVSPERVGLVIVGPGRPYRAKEVSEQFGVDVLAEVAWEPAAASDLAHGEALPRTWQRTRLASSYAAAATGIAELYEAERARIGVPT